MRNLLGSLMYSVHAASGPSAPFVCLRRLVIRAETPQHIAVSFGRKDIVSMRAWQGAKLAMERLHRAEGKMTNYAEFRRKGITLCSTEILAPRLSRKFSLVYLDLTSISLTEASIGIYTQVLV